MTIMLEIIWRRSIPILRNSLVPFCHSFFIQALHIEFLGQIRHREGLDKALVRTAGFENVHQIAVTLLPASLGKATHRLSLAC